MSDTKPPKKHRGPGRPKGSKDLRPMLIELLQRYRLFPVLMAEFEAAKAEMSAKERLAFSLELAKLGIAASPRTLDMEGGTTIRLMINGIGQGVVDAPGEIVQHVEPSAPALPPFPRTLPYPADAPGKRLPLVSSRTRPPVDATTEEAPLPPGTQIFRVPSIDDDGPPEWRTPLFPEGGRTDE